jgi:predicted ATPase/DNA-binding CsgD family transcriptional regulator
VAAQQLTRRERAVLAAVGRRLTNPEIAAEMYLSVRTVESHIASLRRKLGADSRKELIAATTEQNRSVDVPDNPLRGRDAELVDVLQLLDERRWVTLTGPGGVGKTRLALESANRSDRSPIVVELEQAAAEDVAARVARALELESVPGDPVPAIISALSAYPYLLVLDNVDHVGDAVAAIVARARAGAADLQVLTTSRTPIGRPAEAVMTVRPLVSDGPESPAAMLLLDRIGAAQNLSPTDRAAAESIATRLDGVPLALELAASAARHFPLDELNAQLAESFSSLDRAAPAGKHRTLETAFEWTWDLLSDDERLVLRSLAALPLSFDLELARAVTDERVEGTVLRLLDHSLLVATEDRPRRFRLLAVMREFVFARTDPALIRSVRERHTLYTTDTVMHAAAVARTDDSPAAVAMARARCPEANAALRWALAADHPVASELAAAVAIGVEQYGADVDTVNALVLAGRNEVVRANSSAEQLLSLGTAISFIDAGLLVELSSLASQRATDERERLAALHLAGIAAANNGRESDALVVLEDAEELASQLGDVWETGAISQLQGVVLASDAIRSAEKAIAALESATRRYVRAGDRMHANNCRYMMALVAAENGIDLDVAAEWAARAAEYAELTGNRHEIAHAHLVQAMLGLGAQTLESLTSEFRALGDLRCAHRSLMLEALALAPAERIPVLEEAVRAAETSANRRGRLLALTGLVDTEWERGERAAVFATLDRISDGHGADAARKACPVDLLETYERDLDA